MAELDRPFDDPLARRARRDARPAPPCTNQGSPWYVRIPAIHDHFNLCSSFLQSQACTPPIMHPQKRHASINYSQVKARYALECLEDPEAMLWCRVVSCSAAA